MDEVSKDIHRVNHAMRLGENYNSSKITLTDTKEVILLMQKDGKDVAIQDNRHEPNKYGEPTVCVFPTVLESIHVDVTLVDERFGALITYTYKIRMSTLAIDEIIRGGRP